MANVAKMLKEAVALHQRGQLEEAERGYRQILSRKRNHPDALHLLGVLALGRGELDRAETLIRRAIKGAPRAHTFFNNLGEVLREKGRFKAAEEAYKRALAIHKSYVEPLVGLGNVRRAQGRYEEAIASLERALKLKPDFPAALLNLGGAYLQAQRLAPAAKVFERLTKLQPSVADHHRQAGMSYFNMGQKEKALFYMRAALRLAPENLDYLRWAVEVLRASEFGAPAPFYEALISRLFGDSRFDPRDLIVPALSLASLRPAVMAAREGAIDVDALARDDLFVVMTSATLVPDPEMERVYVALRRRLLDGVEPLLLPLVAAVALQAHTTEYVWEISPEEDAAVELRLAELLTQGAIGPDDELSLATIACYRPIERSPLADKLAEGPWSTPMGFLLRETVEAARREAAIRPTIPRLTPITEGTSEAVRAQYEEHPYPRWRRMGRPIEAPLLQEIEGMCPRFTRPEWPARPRVLIAGGGSGRHPIRFALAHPEADVLAIDLSLTSLSYARRVADRMKAPNLRLAHGDIMALPDDLGPFDYIEAEGVLHHLADPLAGWRILRGLLTPLGVMRVSLYSEAGRADVRAARARIEAEGLSPDLEGVRRFRALIRDELPKLSRRRDFFTTSMCRDLVFHVQEHRYDIPRLGAELEALEMKLLDFIFPRAKAAQAFLERFPGGDTQDLARWAELEAEAPDTFRNMYGFFCQALS